MPDDLIYQIVYDRDSSKIIYEGRDLELDEYPDHLPSGRKLRSFNVGRDASGFFVYESIVTVNPSSDRRCSGTTVPITEGLKEHIMKILEE